MIASERGIRTSWRAIYKLDKLAPARKIACRFTRSMVQKTVLSIDHGLDLSTLTALDFLSRGVVFKLLPLVLVEQSLQSIVVAS